MADEFTSSLEQITARILERHASVDETPVIPSQASIDTTLSALPTSLPDAGLGTLKTTEYILNDILPGISQGQNGPRYFGFVTGGVTPAAQLAEIALSSYDESVATSRPTETAAAAIEARALELVLDLLTIPREAYAGRTLTTGATASNILGLACARDALYARSPHLPAGYSFARDGPPSSPALPSPPIVLLGVHPHFSITKSAALVGLGSGPKVVHQLPAQADDELAFDLGVLEQRLKDEQAVGRGVVVLYGLGEVNTGGFPRGLPEVSRLCKQYGAWLHIDAAFGGFAGIVPEMRHLVEGIELGDSLTLDGHKWLNVPYDLGLFFTKDIASLTNVFAPLTPPAYLATTSTAPSPIYLGIENSRRFRALPLLASLVSLGKDGYADIVRRNVGFAQRVAAYMRDSPLWEVLNFRPEAREHAGVPLNIVLFRGAAGTEYPPSDKDSAGKLTAAMNATRDIYVSATTWRGIPAVRIAVSNWRTGTGGDVEFEKVKGILEGVITNIALN